MTLKVRILQFLTKLLIILVGLTMTWYIEKWWFLLGSCLVSCAKWTKNLERYLIQGLVAISEGLLFLESLGFSKTIEDELGLPNNINLPKMEKLKSMKNLKKLFIGFLSNTAEYQSILQREIPNLRKHGFHLERKLLTGKLTKVITWQEPTSLYFISIYNTWKND